MGTSRQATVMFAEVSDGGISQCIDRLRNTVEASGGRVLKVAGSELMMVFDTPDGAAAAASRMHAAVEALAAAGNPALALRVGYHAGPVLEAGGDLLGDTVNLAAALLRQARQGQTMTTQQTAQMLSESFRALRRQVYAIPLGPSSRLHRIPAASMLRLNYASEVTICSRENTAVIIGRSPGCGLVIRNALASRRHCTIRLGQTGFTIQDHSSYGTYVTNEGVEEIFLQCTEASLAMHGWLAFGRPRGQVAQVLEFTGL